MNRLAFWLVTLTMTFGCAQKAAGPNQPAQGMAEMEFHGMKVRAEGTNPGVWAVGNMEGITVTVGGKKIVVEKEQILVDGVTKAKIPLGTKSIRAISRNDEVVVEVDGKEVFKLGP